MTSSAPQLSLTAFVAAITIVIIMIYTTIATISAPSVSSS